MDAAKKALWWMLGIALLALAVAVVFLQRRRAEIIQLRASSEAMDRLRELRVEQAAAEVHPHDLTYRIAVERAKRRADEADAVAMQARRELAEAHASGPAALAELWKETLKSYGR